MLDNFATVAEAVAALREVPSYLVAVETPDGHAGSVPLAISDPSGDSAIFEYVAGNLRIHHGRQYQVMTNSPVYDQQLALNAYWEQIGGTTMLPGTNRAADRFVRASFYIKAIPQTADTVKALASQKNRVYYFESSQSPFLLWLALDELDFSEGAPSKRLTLTEESALVEDGGFVSGNAAAWLTPAKPFAFLPAQPS